MVKSVLNEKFIKFTVLLCDLYKTHLQPRPTQLTADADGAPGVDGLHDLIAG